jgi:hypothetical protein
MFESQPPNLSESIEQPNGGVINKSFEISVLEKMDKIYHDLHYFYTTAVIVGVITIIFISWLVPIILNTLGSIF